MLPVRHRLCATDCRRSPLTATAMQACTSLCAHPAAMLLAAGALTAAQLAAITLAATLALAVAERLVKRWKVGGQLLQGGHGVRHSWP